ncbi:MAG: hypothetical protein HC902_01035 [Calothrix sp. SM1_5_4]|nr:hypothetical protein [Calothrix sp. SM1_5_4]
MQSLIRRHPANQCRESQVLQDQGVRFQLQNALQERSQALDLFRKYKNVKCQMSPHPIKVAGLDDLTEFAEFEVDGAAAGIESGKPQIDRISTVVNRGQRHL